MNPLNWKRASLLAFAVVLIMADSAILRGEKDPDDLVFEPPVPSKSDRAYTVSGPLYDRLQHPDARKIRQVGGIQGTDPKNVLGKSSTGAVRNAAAISRTPATKAPEAPNQNLEFDNTPANDASPSLAVPPSPRPASTTSIKPASHNDPLQGLTLDGLDPANVHQRRRNPTANQPMIVSPTDRPMIPGVRGAHLGLQGETATERLLQMRTAVLELERENEDLRQQNAKLQAGIKEGREQLSNAAREIHTARKELGMARTDLDRLRNELNHLRDKVRVAQREHTAVLQSMGPLLQKFLEADDSDALPPSPTE